MPIEGNRRSRFKDSETFWGRQGAKKVISGDVLYCSTRCSMRGMPGANYIECGFKNARYPSFISYTEFSIHCLKLLGKEEPACGSWYQ